MRGFILGLAIGALGAYAAIKLSDEDTRNGLYSRVNGVADKARDEFDSGLSASRGKAMRAGVRVRQEVRKGKQMINQVAGDVAGKLSEELSEFEAKARANS